MEKKKEPRYERYMPQSRASAANLRRRLIAHWEAAHGKLKSDPHCAGCRNLERALALAQERERKK